MMRSSSELEPSWSTVADRYVYRAYNGDELLYVGCTFNLKARMAGHKGTSEWYPLATYFEHDGPMPTAEAFELERQQIATLQPKFNQMAGSKPPSLPSVDGVTVTVRLLPSGIAAIDQLANLEDRTRSQMVRILLAEALKARGKSRG
jgi:hypothetical protein